MKTCRVCGQPKEEKEFYTRDNGKLRNECKACLRLGARGWYRDNKKRALESGRIWAKKNAGKVRSYNQKYRNSHREKERVRRIKYYYNNREKYSERHRAAYRADPEAFRYKAIERKYKLSIEQYEQMLLAQGGRCAICGELPTKGKGKRLHVDHDKRCCPGQETCGKCVRELLCVACNIRVGFYEHQLFNRTMEYVEKWRGNT